MSRVQTLINRYGQLKREKVYLIGLYQLISEYVFSRKQNFNVNVATPGTFVNEDVYDNTAIRANIIMANVMVNNLWPNGPRTFKLTPTWDMPDTEEIKNYYEYANRQMYSVMDNPRSGLITALDEYMLDQGGYGTSGLAVFEEEDDWQVPVRYKAWDVKTMCIDEGPDGIVDTVFNETEMTIRNAVKKYGYKNLSKASRDKFDKGMTEDKIKVLHAIEPREERDPNKYGAKDMPIASIHIELGPNKILKESGFEEMPVFVARFIKILGEKYGRSAAMLAMADILEINATREAISIATEKQLDPPLGVYDDGTLGGGVIDTSAGAINVFSVTGRINNGKPIEPLYTVGELQSSYAHIETLTEKINNHFNLDRLLDFNNETRMTFGEAQLRNALRGQSLGTFYARQELELFTPMIQRTFNILLKRGRLGVLRGSKEEIELIKNGIVPFYIPDAVAQRMLAGKDVFEIIYTSPAKRTMQADELQGIMNTANFAVQVAPVVPDVLDNIDFDKLLRKVSELSGVSTEMLKDMQTIKKIREARAKQQEQAMQLEVARQQSEIGRNVAQMSAMTKGKVA